MERGLRNYAWVEQKRIPELARGQNNTQSNKEDERRRGEKVIDKNQKQERRKCK